MAKQSMTQWWQTSVIYALFPLSFQDSDGDGFGDIQGIISRLDYLSWLGVDAVWLGPLYPSPLVDAGYDVADFCSIDPRFGDLAGFDRMLEEIHARGMRAILDFVPNHTSDTHPWFVESRSARNSQRRDWYIWRDGKPGGEPPTNWIDNVRHPAWTLDERTGQYYYHRFLPEQPDLNYRNPEVVEAMTGALAFWLDRGIDGFRLDAAADLIEDDLLRDEARQEGEDGPPGWKDHPFSTDRPEGLGIIAAFRRRLNRYPEKVLIGEVFASEGSLLRYSGTPKEPKLHLPLNSKLLSLEGWDARQLDSEIEKYLGLLPDGAWPNWILGNHDVPRLATRVGQEQARVAAMLLLTLPGTVFLYYGDEIGAEALKVRRGEERDPYAKFGFGRDAERGPMPWDASENAGFSSGKPWLPIPHGYAERNVAALQADQGSILNLYRQLIALRHGEVALNMGAYAPARAEGEVLSFLRGGGSERVQVALNTGKSARTIELAGSGEVLLSTCLDRQERTGMSLELRANEGVIVRLVTG